MVSATGADINSMLDRILENEIFAAKICAFAYKGQPKALSTVMLALLSAPLDS